MVTIHQWQSALSEIDRSSKWFWCHQQRWRALFLGMPAPIWEAHQDFSFCFEFFCRIPIFFCFSHVLRLWKRYHLLDTDLVGSSWSLFCSETTSVDDGESETNHGKRPRAIGEKLSLDLQISGWDISFPNFEVQRNNLGRRKSPTNLVKLPVEGSWVKNWTENSWPGLNCDNEIGRCVSQNYLQR